MGTMEATFALLLLCRYAARLADIMHAVGTPLRQNPSYPV